MHALRPDWATVVPKRDLQMVHHACRIYAKYPGLSREEEAEAERVADLAWDEVVRRSAAEREHP